MSRTEKRNGEAVFKACMELCKEKGADGGNMVMVGEVAKRANVSHPTARKYLDFCVETEFAQRFVFIGSPLLVYQFSQVE